MTWGPCTERGGEGSEREGEWEGGRSNVSVVKTETMYTQCDVHTKMSLVADSAVLQSHLAMSAELKKWCFITLGSKVTPHLSRSGTNRLGNMMRASCRSLSDSETTVSDVSGEE